MHTPHLSTLDWKHFVRDTDTALSFFRPLVFTQLYIINLRPKHGMLFHSGLLMPLKHGSSALILSLISRVPLSIFYI